MTAVVAVLCALLLFGGLHLLLSASPLRSALAVRFGERRFSGYYSQVAAVGFAVLAFAIARYGDEGLPGPALAAVPVVRWVLGVIAFLGTVFIVAGLHNYFRSPMAVFLGRQRSSDQNKPVQLRAPQGIELVTRHAIFVGVVLLMGAHAALAEKLAGSIYFGGIALLALVGIPLQDRKLRIRYGKVYSDYLGKTSAVPFAAMKRSSLKDLAVQWPAFLVPVFVAVLILVLHPLLKPGNGAAFILLIGMFLLARRISKSRTSRPTGASSG